MQILGKFEFFFEKNPDECLELHFSTFGLKSRSYRFICVKKIQKTKIIHFGIHTGFNYYSTRERMIRFNKNYNN